MGMTDNEIIREMKKLAYSNISSSGTYANVGSYKIRNGKVDYEGYISIPEHYTSIPVPFRSVSGDFFCSKALTSLHNSPIEVGGTFSCAESKITSFEGGPKEVYHNFTARSTNVYSLRSCPITIGGSFYVSSNNLTTLEHAPKEVGDNFTVVGRFHSVPDHSHIKIGGRFRWGRSTYGGVPIVG